MNTTEPITIARGQRGKGLRGKAARARKQQASAQHLEQHSGSGHQQPPRPEPTTW